MDLKDPERIWMSKAEALVDPIVWSCSKNFVAGYGKPRSGPRRS